MSTDDLTSLTRSHAEHDAWGRLCAALHDAGAVTDDDLVHPATATATLGDRVFAAVREWGDALVTLRVPPMGVVVMANDCAEAVVLTPANVAEVKARVQAEMEKTYGEGRVIVHTHEVEVVP